MLQYLIFWERTRRSDSTLPLENVLFDHEINKCITFKLVQVKQGKLDKLRQKMKWFNSACLPKTDIEFVNLVMHRSNISFNAPEYNLLAKGSKFVLTFFMFYAPPGDIRICEYIPLPLMTSHLGIPWCSKYERNTKEYEEYMKEYGENMKEYIKNYM